MIVHDRHNVLLLQVKKKIIMTTSKHTNDTRVKGTEEMHFLTQVGW